MSAAWLRSGRLREDLEIRRDAFGVGAELGHVGSNRETEPTVWVPERSVPQFLGTTSVLILQNPK